MYILMYFIKGRYQLTKYYFILHKGPGIPKYSIIDNRINKGNPQIGTKSKIVPMRKHHINQLCVLLLVEKTVLENNEDFKGLISDKAMPTMLRDKIKLYGFGKLIQQLLTVYILPVEESIVFNHTFEV